MTYLYGFRVCDCVAASAPLVEKRLREAGLVTNGLAGIIAQGCYSTAVRASAMTHARGGVLDLKDWSPYRADIDNLLTSLGWCGAYRTKAQGFTSNHWHVVLNGCPHLHPQAQAQLTDFINGLNGLAGKGKDSGPRPSVTWQEALADSQPHAPLTQVPLLTEDEDMFVIATSDGSYRLVTPQGSVDCGSMANVDAVLSVLNAKASRTYGPSPYGWRVVAPASPCLASEVQVLDALLARIA